MLFALIFLMFFFIFLATYLYSQEKQLTDKIYPNVFIDNIDFGRKRVEDLKNYFQKKNQQLKEVEIFLVYKNQEKATFSAENLGLKYNDEILVRHAFLIGRTPAPLTKFYQKLAAILNLTRFDFSSNLVYDSKPIEDFLTFLEEKYNQPAVNALFELKDRRVTAFKKEKEGLMIDKEKTLDQLQTNINRLKTKFQKKLIVNVFDQIIKPEITLSSINNFGIVEKIGEGKSDYSGSINERIHNIILASSKFHGVLIPKGEIFSFNKTLGDVSSTTGYKPAYIIKNGRTVLGDGGGVCQVSTTLFRAALNAGLPIIEREAHAYRVHYYENDSQPGFDATVFNPSPDLKIKNDTPAHILIQTETNQEKNWLIFYLYGKKDDRKVEISQAAVWDVLPPPEPLYQEDPTLKKGVIKQIDWASWEAKAKFHYKVEKAGKVIIDQDFFSSYHPWRAVYLVGTGK